jgi:hypothetical protein
MSPDFPLEAVLGITLPFLTGAIVAVTLIVSSYRRKMQRDDMEATLKMEMIERGMSAEDIERVLAARIGPSSRHKRHACSWQRHERRGEATHPVQG